MKIKKGDNIIVLAGKDKGKTGNVAQVFPKTDMVLVDGVNIITKHQKNRQARSQGQVIKKPAPLHISNIAFVDEGKPVKIGYKIEGDKKVRVNKKTGKNV